MKKQGLSDEILQAAIDGDANAFASLCRHKAQDVFFMASKILQNKEDAEDAAQEAFLYMQQHIGELQGPAQFPGWMYRVVIAACQNSKWRKTKIPVDPIESFEGEKFTEEREEFLPIAYAENREKQDELLRVIHHLPYRCRMAVLLYYYEGFSYREIAQSLSVKKKDVDNALVKAKKLILRQLSAEEESDTRKAGLWIPMPVIEIALRQEAASLRVPPALYLPPVSGGLSGGVRRSPARRKSNPAQAGMVQAATAVSAVVIAVAAAGFFFLRQAPPETPETIPSAGVPSIQNEPGISSPPAEGIVPEIEIPAMQNGQKEKGFPAPSSAVPENNAAKPEKPVRRERPSFGVSSEVSSGVSSGTPDDGWQIESIVPPVQTPLPEEDYHRQDVRAADKLIDQLGLDWPAGAPQDWPQQGASFVEWSGENPKRIKGLALQDLGLSGNLDVSGFSALEWLLCDGNALTKLKIGGLTSLKELNCGRNQLQTLDIGGCFALERLYCAGNNLNELNLTGCAALGELSCGQNTALSQITNPQGAHLSWSAGEGGTLLFESFELGERLLQLTAVPSPGFYYTGLTGAYERAMQVERPAAQKQITFAWQDGQDTELEAAFTREALAAPSVSSVSSTKAAFACAKKTDDPAQYPVNGFLYARADADGNPAGKWESIRTDSAQTAFRTQVQGLELNTRYLVKAYAEAADGRRLESKAVPFSTAQGALIFIYCVDADGGNSLLVEGWQYIPEDEPYYLRPPELEGYTPQEYSLRRDDRRYTLEEPIQPEEWNLSEKFILITVYYHADPPDDNPA